MSLNKDNVVHVFDMQNVVLPLFSYVVLKLGEEIKSKLLKTNKNKMKTHLVFRNEKKMRK